MAQKSIQFIHGILLTFLAVWFVPDSRAEGEVSAAPSPVPNVKKSAKRGKRREQKETEGTEAPERFEADTILKSPYSVDGQPLEVDPD